MLEESSCNGQASGHGHEVTLAILSSMALAVQLSLDYLKEQGGC